MRNPRAAGLIPAAVLAVAAAGASTPPAAPAGFGWFGTLAGSCWHGEYPGGGGDTQCYEWQYRRYLRGTIEIVPASGDGSQRKLAGDSVFDWDAKAGRIRYANWSDAGSLQHGEAYYEGSVLLFPDVRSRDEEPRSRSSWRRIDDDTFEVTRERRDGESWVAEFKVTYRRR